MSESRSKHGMQKITPVSGWESTSPRAAMTAAVRFAEVTRSLAREIARRRVALRACVWLLALATALAFSQPAHALNPDRSLTQALHRIWQMQQGLPQAAIFKILQTSDGFLWLGTQAGLV